MYSRPILARQPVDNTPLNRTERHHKYGPVLPHQQNAFGMLRPTCVDSDEESINTVAMQVAALTNQSQLTASTAANSSQHAEQQFASQQNLMHENMQSLRLTGSALTRAMRDKDVPWSMATEAADIIADGARKVSPLRFLTGASLMRTADLPQLPADLPQALNQGLSPMETCP